MDSQFEIFHDFKDYYAKYGKIKKEMDLTNKFGEPYSTIHYISGINEFDSFLQGIPFAKVKLIHSLYITDTKITNVLVSRDGKIVILAVLDKALIKKISLIESTNIEIREVNSITNIFKSGIAGGGLFGSLASVAVGHLSEKLISITKGVKSKNVTGSIFQLEIPNSIITLSCIKSDAWEVKRFFTKNLELNF